MRRNFLLLLLIFFFALAIRLLMVSPHLRLSQDELSIGYNAYSILQTSKDEWGRQFPMVFQAFGDYKQPAYIYLTVPFIAFLGLTSLAVKLPSIIAGALVVVLITLIAQKIIDTKTGYLIGFITSISPWSLQLSRFALESHVGLLFFLSGVLCLLNYLENKEKKYWLVASGVFWAVSMYAYIAYRLIVGVLLLLITVAGGMKKEYRRSLAILLISFSVALLPLLPQLIGQGNTARFNQVSIFSDGGVNAASMEKANYCFIANPKIGLTVCRLLNLPIAGQIQKVSISYLQMISPGYLFLQGDSSPHYSFNGYGEFYWVLFPLYLIGLIELFRRSDSKSRLLQVAFLIAPIPSALTGEAHVVRGSLVFALVAIAIALGIHWLSRFWHKNNIGKVMIGIGMLTLIWTASDYFVHYYLVYPLKYDAALYPIDKEVSEYLNDNEHKYERVIIDDTFSNPHIFLAFYQQIDPNWYRDNIVMPEEDDLGFQHPTKLGKYEFRDFASEPIVEEYVCSDDGENTLLVSRPQKDFKPLISFKGGGDVHVQADVIDADHLRQQLTDIGKLGLLCREQL